MSKDKPPFWITSSLGITAQSSGPKGTRIQLFVSNLTIWRYLLTPQEKKTLKPGINTLNSALFVRMLIRHPGIPPLSVPFASHQVRPPS